MGIMSVSIETAQWVRKRNKSFRPLWGSCLSQSNEFCTDDELKIMFPSPMGIMSVSMSTASSGICSPMMVSVPYGDHVCLNLAVTGDFLVNVTVSVPYGDHVCLNSLLIAIRWLRRMFPSPMGIMSVSMGAGIKDRILQACFRPLWGSCLSQSVQTAECYNQ